MSGKTYDIRKARRERERQRALCGETYGEYNARAKGRPNAKPGSELPRVRCDRTVDAFNPEEDNG